MKYAENIKRFYVLAACTHKLGQAMKKKYKREMDYVYAVINEMDRKLDRQIRDLDDVRTVMDTLSKIREQEVDMELKIEPIEDAFNMMHKYEIQVDREQMDQVDNLRYTWVRLQSRAKEVHCKLLEMQPDFQSDLRANLEKFKQDKIEYVTEYRASGPMQPGLTPREASDKLLLFQVNFLFMVMLCRSTLSICIIPESIRRNVEKTPDLSEWRGIVWFASIRLS